MKIQDLIKGLKALNVNNAKGDIKPNKGNINIDMLQPNGTTEDSKGNITWIDKSREHCFCKITVGAFITSDVNKADALRAQGHIVIDADAVTSITNSGSRMSTEDVFNNAV